MSGKDEFFPVQLSASEERLQKLIAGCVNEERAAQSALYKHTFDFFYRIAIRYERGHDDAIAMINEAFYKILKNIGKFNQTHSFYPWGKTILLHCIFNKFKQSNSLKNMLNTGHLSLEDEMNEVPIAPDVLNKIESEHVLAILECLPETTRKIFNLFVMENYAHKEIAELLNISVNASKWHVFEGKRKLTEKIKSFQPIQKDEAQ